MEVGSGATRARFFGARLPAPHPHVKGTAILGRVVATTPSLRGGVLRASSVVVLKVGPPRVVLQEDILAVAVNKAVASKAGVLAVAKAVASKVGGLAVAKVAASKAGARTFRRFFV